MKQLILSWSTDDFITLKFETDAMFKFCVECSSKKGIDILNNAFGGTGWVEAVYSIRQRWDVMTRILHSAIHMLHDGILLTNEGFFP